MTLAIHRFNQAIKKADNTKCHDLKLFFICCCCTLFLFLFLHFSGLSFHSFHFTACLCLSLCLLNTETHTHIYTCTPSHSYTHTIITLTLSLHLVLSRCLSQTERLALMHTVKFRYTGNYNWKERIPFCKSKSTRK